MVAERKRQLQTEIQRQAKGAKSPFTVSPISPSLNIFQTLDVCVRLAIVGESNFTTGGNNVGIAFLFTMDPLTGAWVDVVRFYRQYWSRMLR